MHDNVPPHDFPVSLSREDVADAFLIAYPVEGNAVLGGTEKSVHQGEIMVGSEG